VLQLLEGRDLPSTFYVATTGSDTAAGSAIAPWKTLQKAANTLVAGDTVHVAAGTYVGFNRYGKSSGTAAAPISFLADPGVVINHVPSTGLPNDSVADINIEASGNYYIIQGFTIQGAGTQKAGIRVTDSDNTQILNNAVDRAFTGIFVSYSQGVVVQGNTCTNSTDQHGIYMSGDQNYVVRGNTLVGNNWDGLHLNIVDGVGTPNSGGLIENNVIRGNTLSGMDIEGVTNSVFRNNLVYGNVKHGFTLHNLDQTGPTPPCTGNLFVNNTAAGNGMFGIQMAAGGNTANTLYNNVFFSTSSTYGSIGTSGTPTGLVSDYNVVLNSFSTTLGQSKITLAQWQSQSGQDTHSVVSSPATVFTNAAANDYRLKTGSPAVDTGTANQAPAVDIVGTSRPQGAGTDVGAYELSTTPVPGTLQFSAAAYSAAEVAGGVTVTVTRTGGSSGAISVQSSTTPYRSRTRRSA
jgi:parallel beta-helix repeat protein